MCRQGAAQFARDVRAVGALLAPYTPRPAAHFRELLDAAMLLTLPEEQVPKYTHKSLESILGLRMILHAADAAARVGAPPRCASKLFSRDWWPHCCVSLDAATLQTLPAEQVRSQSNFFELFTCNPRSYIYQLHVGRAGAPPGPSACPRLWHPQRPWRSCPTHSSRLCRVQCHRSFADVVNSCLCIVATTCVRLLTKAKDHHYCVVPVPLMT